MRPFDGDEERRTANLKRFWDDDDVQHLLADAEADVMQEWRNAATLDDRERCHAEIRAMDKLKAKFRALVGE